MLHSNTSSAVFANACMFAWRSLLPVSIVITEFTPPNVSSPISGTILCFVPASET